MKRIKAGERCYQSGCVALAYIDAVLKMDPPKDGLNLATLKGLAQSLREAHAEYREATR